MFKHITILLILICIYLLLVSGRLSLPLTGDDPTQLVPYGTLTNVHPPLFHFIVRFLTNFLHLSAVQLRIIGITCFMVDLMLTYLLVRIISRDNLIALLGALLFVSSPMAIQGSLLIDMDNTILTVALMLFILYFAVCYDKLKLKDCLILGFLFFLSLFSKFTTPFALIPSLVIFYTLKKRFLWGASRVILISFVGIGLFLLTWQYFAYYYKLPFVHIFKRPIEMFLQHSGFSNIKFLKHIATIWLWFGPALLFIPIILISRIKKYWYREVTVLDFCIIYIIVIFLGHNFLEMTAHGFPKYLYPILPAFAVLVALFLRELGIKLNLRDLVASSMLIPVTVIYNLFIPGDIIYTFHINLRQNIIFNFVNIKVFFADIFLPILSYPLFILLIFFILKLLNRHWRGLSSLSMAVFIVAISSNISLDILQAKAEYATNCYYGRSIQDMHKLGEFFKAVKQKYPQSLIIGPEDVYNEPHMPCLEYPWNGDIGRSPQAFLQAILDKKVVCIAYSLSWNSIYTYKNVILKPEIQKALKDNFKYCPIGEYSVWLRK